jgi:hypothetical protein
MQNGDSLVGEAWYQEMVIVPDPGNPMRYYIFCAGITSPVTGLFYSVIDLSYNNGLGKVVQKNVQLRSDTLCDGITATKHGNGIDWWIVVRSWKALPLYTNDVTSYLVSPSGVTANSTQYIGSSLTNESFYRAKFNTNGDKIYYVALEGLIERLDFDRCTGVLSNPNTISTFGGPFGGYWGFAVSTDNSKIYTTSIYRGANQDSSYLLQFDLNDPNFLASVDTLGVFVAPAIAGLLQLGPDNKIYLSVTWAGADSCYDYLYCSSTVNTTNSNISVINFPDSLGSACNFQPFSFYLGGHKAYWGLPNNPNYELGRLVGSPCDTITSIDELSSHKSSFSVYYNDQWQTAFVNASGLQGRNYKMQLIDLNGQIIFEENGRLDSEYLTKDLVMNRYASGWYIISVTTEKEKLVKKFVKN